MGELQALRCQALASEPAHHSAEKSTPAACHGRLHTSFRAAIKLSNEAPQRHSNENSKLTELTANGIEDEASGFLNRTD